MSQVKKPWGRWGKSVVIDVCNADPLNPKRWSRAKSKVVTLSLRNDGRDKACIPKVL